MYESSSQDGKGDAWPLHRQGLGNCKEQDKGEWDKLQFLVPSVPTFWDYMTYMIQPVQRASWGTEAGQAGGYVRF